MTVVFDRPYQFVPPHRGDLWPAFIQTFRLVDRYLAHSEGIVSHDCRGMDSLRESLERKDGIVLAPNHCRVSDPLVMVWPARETKTHVFAMASWHLFNQGWLDSFAIQKMGGFSIFREGRDRQSLETAIEILTDADRPLILFPEGTTNGTNDLLRPLLDGVTFIGRSAARRRAKQAAGRVVMHPVGIKYLCEADLEPWAEKQLAKLEERLGWRRQEEMSVIDRTIRLAEGLLVLKEIEYCGQSASGQLPQRRDELIDFLLDNLEQSLDVSQKHSEIFARVRAIRTSIASKLLRLPDNADKSRLKAASVAVDLALELHTYPDGYLLGDDATDTRVVETIQRMQESLLGRADASMPLRVVIQCAEPIVVPPERAPRDQPDPVLANLECELLRLVNQLSREANPVSRDG